MQKQTVGSSIRAAIAIMFVSGVATGGSPVELTSVEPTEAPALDLAIINGRVIDPESGLDDVRNVGIQDGRIVIVTRDPLSGRRTVNAKGLAVAPGFIDLHAHGQSLPADRMQAFDGVTTALELESGILPIGEWYAAQASPTSAV